VSALGARKEVFSRRVRAKEGRFLFLGGLKVWWCGKDGGVGGRELRGGGGVVGSSGGGHGPWEMGEEGKLKKGLRGITHHNNSSN